MFHMKDFWQRYHSASGSGSVDIITTRHADHPKPDEKANSSKNKQPAIAYRHYLQWKKKDSDLTVIKVRQVGK